MSEESEMAWIAGFWRRIGALVIDILLLGIIGLLSGFALGDYFAQIGIWGRLVGFSVALVYFGVMNSVIFNGQTLGKKLLKIKVVNSDNQPISLVKSFGRYTVLGIPFFLNGAQFSMETMTSFWMYILSILIFGGLFAIVYLYLFNRRTRQSLHDLVFSTYVVNVAGEKQDIENVWKPHLAVVAVLFIASALVPVFTMNLAQKEPFSGLLKSIDALYQNPAVNYATMSYSFATAGNDKNNTSYISAQVFVNKDEVSNPGLARELAKIITRNCNLTKNRDVLSIVLIYGYDIGIASSWMSHQYSFDPDNIDKSGEKKTGKCI